VGRGRPFRIEWRAEDTADRLRQLYRAEKDGTVRTRLHGLWLLRTGRRLGEVAATVGVNYRTVQQWAARYRAGGVPAVTAPRAGGRGQPPRLSPEQQAEVADAVATGRFRTAAQIRDWIAAEYGVDYKVSGVYALLERLRCRPKVPRPLHVKADLAEQERWEKGA
jgi:transposase